MWFFTCQSSFGDPQNSHLGWCRKWSKTNEESIVISGDGASGQLMGAVVNQAPELWASGRRSCSLGGRAEHNSGRYPALTPISNGRSGATQSRTGPPSNTSGPTLHTTN